VCRRGKAVWICGGQRRESNKGWAATRMLPGQQFDFSKLAVEMMFAATFGLSDAGGNLLAEDTTTTRANQIVQNFLFFYSHFCVFLTERGVRTSPQDIVIKRIYTLEANLYTDEYT
jgi:hypothetical protein